MPRNTKAVINVANTAAKEPSLTIILVGITGSGKSKFIRIADGIPDDLDVAPRVGHDLRSQTAEVEEFTVTYRSQAATKSVRLVDTPGFDDSNNVGDDFSVKKIVKWLKEDPDSKIHGFLYLHEITDCRIREDVKPDTIPQPPGTLVVTTKWSNISTGTMEEHQKAVNRFEELQTKRGFQSAASVHRFDETKESAWDIINAVQVSLAPKTRKDLAADLEIIWPIFVAKPSLLKRLWGKFKSLF
ncbi:hypothetical protein BDN70DRAFT_641512 [Pholiota conissans]|uniref:G domain-containing protein n=1 Tax=Pholiota conissans TaxID=109636 RepID=A0A9P5Z4P5_9AGAR|nr:hypothetical protein BDN70DRAFT_641512 [Pholiota conissans]